MITVLVPAYNEEKLIGACLLSLLEQQPAPDEILVVDNNSTDHTVSEVQRVQAKYPNANIRLMNAERQGCIWAREAGWRAAQGDVIVHVDADETFPQGWMAKIHELLAQHPEAGAIGGVIRFEDAPFIIWLSQVLYNRLYSHIMRASHGFPYLCGGMTIVRREVLEAMDGYKHIPDDQLDDFYLAAQAHERGYELIFTPDLWVSHSLRRYEEGGLKSFFQWGVATFDANLYEKAHE